MNLTSYSEITEAIRKAPRKVTLIGVTKSVGIDATNEIIKAGVSAIGENRVEDFEKKLPHLLPADSASSPQVEKHFIGQIQSKKIKRIVELFDVIQSVSSIPHLLKIGGEASEQHKNIRVLLQFNISEEFQKGGFEPNNLKQIIQAMASDPLSVNSRELTDRSKTISAIHRVEIIGVMGMASQTDDKDVVRKQFSLLKTIRDQLHAKFPEITELSMGMSNDYKIALEEGATMLRIGRLLFSDDIMRV